MIRKKSIWMWVIIINLQNPIFWSYPSKCKRNNMQKDVGCKTREIANKLHWRSKVYHDAMFWRKKKTMLLL